MKTIDISVEEVGRIIETKEPAEHYDALRQLFLGRFGIDIEGNAAEGLSKDKLEESISSSELDTLPLSPEQEKMSSSGESLALSSDEQVRSSSDDNDNTIDPHRTVFTGAKINEKENCPMGNYSISFSGGSLFKIESNKGNTWIVCVGPEKILGGLKEVYKVDWWMSIKKGGPAAYKDKHNKYVLMLFRQHEKEKGQNEAGFTEEDFTVEVFNAHFFHTGTKKLFRIRESESQNQYGFLMPNLGDSLIDVVNDNKYSVDKRIEIAESLIDKVKILLLKDKLVHCDLKLDNVCVNQSEAFLIDFDGIISPYEKLDRALSMTREDLPLFIWDPEQPAYQKFHLLKKGPYQILCAVSNLVKTCSYLIHGNYNNRDMSLSLPEGFNTQVEEYFIAHYPLTIFGFYAGFDEVSKKIDSYFRDLEKSELKGMASKDLLEKSVSFAKNIFESLHHHLEWLRYEITLSFANRVLKFEKDTLKYVDLFLTRSEVEAKKVGYDLDDVQIEQLRYEISVAFADKVLKFEKDTLRCVDLCLKIAEVDAEKLDRDFYDVKKDLYLVGESLKWVTGSLKWVIGVLDDGEENLDDVEESLDDVSADLNEVTREFLMENTYLSSVKELLGSLIISLNNVGVNLNSARKEVNSAKAAVDVAKKILYSISKSADTEKKIIEDRKNELDLVKRNLDSRQESLNLLQEKVSEYKKEVNGWMNEVRDKQIEARELESQASEQKNRARKFESQARGLTSQAVELESQAMELENKSPDSVNRALSPVQDKKRKREVGRVQFWSEPCLPTSKKVKYETAQLQPKVIGCNVSPNFQ